MKYQVESRAKLTVGDADLAGSQALLCLLNAVLSNPAHTATVTQAVATAGATALERPTARVIRRAAKLLIRNRVLRAGAERDTFVAAADVAELWWAVKALHCKLKPLNFWPTFPRGYRADCPCCAMFPVNDNPKEVRP